MSGRSRLPAVAGSFYPENPARLAALVARLRDAAATAPRPPELDPAGVIGLLVPHAGLVYSGIIAALGWNLAGEIGPATIVLAGTDHQGLATGIGVWAGGPWETPAGSVAIDDDLATRIAALGKPFARDDGAHSGEHSIEVQLPLVGSCCPAARIVPLAVSPRLREHARAGQFLGRLLAERRAAGERILLVASSDMAHYPPARVCEAADAELMEPLLRLDADALGGLDDSIARRGLPGLVCGLCGIDPVRVTLAALREMGATRGILLGAATSADAGGDPRRTVGYATAAFV
jgi:MEMO1 family protein